METPGTVGIAAAVVERRVFRIEAFACLKSLVKLDTGKLEQRIHGWIVLNSKGTGCRVVITDNTKRGGSDSGATPKQNGIL
jgi:hypothetical protein